MMEELKTTPVREEKIGTIYFGGGTPSVVPFHFIQEMLKVIYDRFDVIEDVEITLETNPDDISVDSAMNWIEAGINRLSIGIQSFDDTELKWMNRVHSSSQAITGLEIVRNAGFKNFSCDLIYGSPFQSNESLLRNIDTLLQFDVPHISAYALTVEPGTALHSFIRKGKSADVDQAHQSEAFRLLASTLKSKGYVHYEISNFCIPGMQSRHNSSYWEGKPYYGIGPGAHSYDGSLERKWNISNNALYATGIENGHPNFESEILTNIQRINEMIMISLRTSTGLDAGNLDKILPGSSEKFRKEAEKFIAGGKLIREGDKYLVTDEGKMFADGIASDLFF